MPKAYKCDECGKYYDTDAPTDLTTEPTSCWGKGKGLDHGDPNYHVYTKRIIKRYVGDQQETHAYLCPECFNKIYKKAADEKKK